MTIQCVRRIDYGILHRQSCMKLRLSTDESSDSHYVSHLDGRLYVYGTKDAYDVDSYRIEFTSTDSIEVRRSVDNNKSRTQHAKRNVHV